MDELKVRMVTLPPLRVACINGFGKEPETLSWQKLCAWMKKKGLDKDYEQRRFFGYNNPSPTPGSPNYGYDTWVTVDASVQPEDGVRIIDFPGGLYAVTHVDKVEEIGSTWKQLVRWMESSRYRHGRHQWLEEHLGFDRDLTHLGGLDLYCPVVES